MYYRHHLDYRYPQRSDQHMIDVKHLRDVNLDENYPYLQKKLPFQMSAYLSALLPVLRAAPCDVGSPWAADSRKGKA